MLQIWLAKSAKEAREVTSTGGRWVAIETEYGDETVDEKDEGVSLSLNHHGELQNQDAPALAYKKNIGEKFDNFIISHVDLDVLFGILWTSGMIKKTSMTTGLSILVAMSDVNGYHTMGPILKKLPSNVREKFWAIGYLLNSWIINGESKTKKDFSDVLYKLLLRIQGIIENDVTPEQIRLYEDWFKSQQASSKKHLREIHKLASSDQLFVYRAPFNLTTAYEVGDQKAVMIVQYHEQAKSITIACYNDAVAKEYFGKRGVLTPLKKYFGKDAGGKMAIGGTSRNHELQPEMLSGFIEFIHREYFNKPEVIDLTDKLETIEISGKKIITIKDSELFKSYPHVWAAQAVQKMAEVKIEEHYVDGAVVGVGV